MEVMYTMTEEEIFVMLNYIYVISHNTGKLSILLRVDRHFGGQRR